jgi:hypothetical protein
MQQSGLARDQVRCVASLVGHATELYGRWAVCGIVSGDDERRVMSK